MEKKKMGRPRSDTEAVNLRLPRAMLQEIDGRRKLEADLPTRPEMIRRILERFFEGQG